MVKNIYCQINKGGFWTCLIVSIALLVTSFLLPPMGVISPTVLQGVGELFAFATLSTIIAAIHKGSDVTLTHGNTSVTVNNPDPDSTEETV